MANRKLVPRKVKPIKPKAGVKGPGRPTKTEVSSEADLKEKYLDILRRIGYTYHAAKMVGITPKILDRWLQEDPAFAASYKEIVEEVEKLRLNDLEAAAFQRAIARSDQLMKFLLSALDPNKYRERVEQDVKARLNVQWDDNLELEEL